MTEKEWVNLNQAVELTGMKSAAITYLVRANRVRKQEGVGPRSHKYNVADLLAAKDEHTPRHYRPRGSREEPQPVLIDWIRFTDVGAGLTLAQQLYAEDVDLADVPRYAAWRKYNPYISMGAFSQDRKECYAALMLVPLEEPTILDVLSGRRMESSLTTEDVLQYDRPGGYTLLAASALCLPDRPYLLNRVLAHMVDFWIEQYPERYMSRIYAQAVSKQGYELVKHAYMTPLFTIGPDAWLLDFSYPNPSRLVQRFMQRLEEKAPLPAELASPHVPPVFAHPVAPDRQPAPAAPIVASASVPRQKTSIQEDTLPAGYKGFTDMVKDHGLSETSMRRGLGSEYTTTEGRWYARGRLVSHALDAGQQRAFLQFARHFTRFRQCEDPACPCHEIESVS